jgi:hypothetical protein
MNKKPNRLKQFVQNHPNLMIGVTSGLTMAVVLQNRGIKNLNAYLKEKGLFDEYYFVDEE